jgi:TonB family protein
MPELKPRSSRSGIVIIAILAGIFFGILTLMLSSGGGKLPGDSRTAEPAFVIPAKLRVRTAPSSQGAVVTTVSAGEQVAVIDQQEGWSHVRTADGIVGWAERSSLEGASERGRKAARATAIRALPPIDGVVIRRTALYAGPGIFYPIVGQLIEAAKVRVFTRDHDFFAIDRGGEIAFADIDDIDLPTGEQTKVDVAGGSQGPLPATATEAPPETPQMPPEEVSPEGGGLEMGEIYLTVPPGGTQPVALDRVRPRYPVRARAAGTEGPVVIRAVVRKDGSVDDVEIVRDQPNGLGEAAREAVEEWRFRPATFHGQPIDVYYTVTVNFRLAG